MMLGEHRLGVEQIHLAGTAMLKQADYRSSAAFSSAICLAAPRTCCAPLGSSFTSGLFLIKQVRKRDRPQGACVTAQEGTAVQTKKRMVHISMKAIGLAIQSTYRKALLARSIWQTSAQAFR